MTKIRWCQAPLLLCAICLCSGAETFAQVQPAQTTEVPRQGQVSAQTQTTQQATTAATDGRVPLAETALSRSAAGEVLLAGTLRATSLAGTAEAPIQNVRFVVENRSPAEYSYLSGRVTFYDATGVRCGEGLFTANSFAPNERAEVDAPGLRLVCAPVAWRIAPVALVSGGALVAPVVTNTANLTTAPDMTNATLSGTPSTAAVGAPVQRLSIEINGTVMPVQIGNPIEVEVGGERVRIVVRGTRP